MNREVHVRFCERLGVKFPGPTRRVSRRSESAPCCAFDEGRSLGAAVQEEAPNRHERLRSKAAVVNVMVKRRDEIASGMDERDERK